MGREEKTKMNAVVYLSVFTILTLLTSGFCDLTISEMFETLIAEDEWKVLASGLMSLVSVVITVTMLSCMPCHRVSPSTAVAMVENNPILGSNVMLAFNRRGSFAVYFFINLSLLSITAAFFTTFVSITIRYYLSWAYQRILVGLGAFGLAIVTTVVFMYMNGTQVALVDEKHVAGTSRGVAPVQKRSTRMSNAAPLRRMLQQVPHHTDKPSEDMP